MKILVVGSGAREHAILRALDKENAHELYVVGGNPGIWEIATQVFEASVDIKTPVQELDGAQIAHVCNDTGIDLCVVGPEAPLAAGVVDILHDFAPNTRVFGPTKAAAELEASKTFAKDVMNLAGVPTAAAKKCSHMSELVAALKEADSSVPYVVKDDGLAAGKGVIVTDKKSEVEAHASAVFHNGGFVILEEYLPGPEFSQFFICDGKVALPLQPAQDFKRIFDDDKGANTGGMGSYLPLDWLPDGTVKWCTENVAQPVVDEMAKRGTPFIGVLFAGLVYTPSGVKVIEFNVRFGDPETQCVLESMQTSLSDLLYAAAGSELSKDTQINWSDEYFCNVVLASAGYPESSHKGDVIEGMTHAQAKGAVLLEAGTTYSETDIGQIVTNGGRVLSVIAHAKNLELARNKAYNYVDMIKFNGVQFRNDIALKAVKEEIVVN